MPNPKTTDQLEQLAARISQAAIEQATCAIHPDVTWADATVYADSAVKLFSIAASLRASKDTSHGR